MALKIAVDSGHGMNTAGKRTPLLTEDLYIDGKLVRRKGECIKEKEFNKPTAEYLIKALKRCGFEVLDVSPGDMDFSLETRVKSANAFNADLFISKHYNALAGNYFQSKAKGIVSIYSQGSERSKKAAQIIQKHLIGTHGGYSYGARADKDISGYSLYVLKNTKMTAVLTESGFMDNVAEAKRMLDPKFQKADAEATCKGICEYFNTKYIDEKESSKPSSDKKWDNGDYNIRVRTTANLNLRTGRGTNFPIVHTIPKGTEFTIGYVFNNWGSTWSFVEQVGYFCCDYIEKI